MYASMKAPASIDTMLDQVEQSQHLTLPLANLAYRDPCQKVRGQILYGTYVGVNNVNGEECDHLAFSTSTTDLQLWLARSGKPVPRKIVINYQPSQGLLSTLRCFRTGNSPNRFPIVILSHGFQRTQNASSF